jgi:hypothetical protein
LPLGGTVSSRLRPASAKEIMADIANYTDLTPVMQISEVVVGQSVAARLRRRAMRGD